MNKNIFILACALIVGLIVSTCCLTLPYLGGVEVTTANALFAGLFSAIMVFIALQPIIFEKLRHLCCDIDWAEAVSEAYNSISPVWRKSFWVLFGFLNLAFLFHTINFMWGAHDWAAVRFAVDGKESLADGRFSAYWLQELLFNGKILPVANNLWAFLGLSFAGVWLVMYWQLPQKTALIVLIGLFLTATPYTLSWLYSTRNTLGVLWIPALSLAALLLSEQNDRTPARTYIYNVFSVLLFIAALGTRFAAINFIMVAILGKVILRTVYADISLKSAMLRVRQGLANFTAALMTYIFILLLLNELGSLNTTSSNLPFAIHWGRIPLIMISMFTQFIRPVPFIDLGYKIMLLILMITAIFTLILKAPNGKAALRGLTLVPVLLFCSRLSFLFTTEPLGAHPAQMDFFALPLVYALGFSLIISLGGLYLRRFGYVLAGLLVFMSFVRIAYAEKVWKFGWDAETKLAERIITRLEKLPEFNIDKQYKLLQIGEMSLRKNYYQKQPYENASPALLEEAYYPKGKSKDAYNFFYQTDFLSENASLSAAIANPEIREFLINTAQAWPAKNSLKIIGDYIIFVLDDAILAKIQRRLR